MRVNKLNDMMKVIIKGTPLEDSWKTFSNHSARKRVVKKLKTAGVEQSAIVKVTGHWNERSPDDYDEGDENEQRQLSHTISYGTNINSQLAQGNSSTLLNSSTNSSSNKLILSTRPHSTLAATASINTSNIGGIAPEKPQSAPPDGEDNI